MKDKAAKDKSRKGRKKKAGKRARPDPVMALPAPDRPNDTNLLDVSRIQWQHGDWADLAQLDADRLAAHPERARLALIVAAAHAQLGDTATARTFADHALAWGCSRSVAAQVLISSAHNALGRVATALQDPAALGHFTTALRIVEPNGDLPLLARSRQIRETTRMGLLPEAADLLAIDMAQVAQAPADHAARMVMLDTRLVELKHQLSLSLSRGQLHTRLGDPGPLDLSQKSLAELGQDLWVLDRTGHKRGGYFVEFGASNGVLLSNTLLLEREFGWTGLLAEPNPGFFAELQNNRTCITSPACIGARTGQEVDFILADEQGGIADDAHPNRDAFRAQGKVIRLITIALDDFLRQHNAPRQIDYLSLNTQGTEFDILRDFPFQNWTIRLITVDHSHAPQRDSITNLLQSHGYTRTEREGNDWYELTPQHPDGQA